MTFAQSGFTFWTHGLRDMIGYERILSYVKVSAYLPHHKENVMYILCVIYYVYNTYIYIKVKMSLSCYSYALSLAASMLFRFRLPFILLDRHFYSVVWSWVVGSSWSQGVLWRQRQPPFRPCSFCFTHNPETDDV